VTVIVFDIETVPDVASGRRLYGLEELPDAEVAEAMFHQRRQQSGSEFLRPHLHRIVAISLVMRHRDSVKVWSLGAEDAPEQELVLRFFDGLGKFTPTLVSWNGGGFDLPVLHYRALLHGVSAPRYWEVGERDQDFRWNNYLNRFQWRHIDLMDVVAGYQPRAVAPLDEIATLLGFPGKMGMHGGKVWEAFQAGDIAGIRHYCETDALNTYLVYLRFQLMRGQLSADEYRWECGLLREMLTARNEAHLREFMSAWQSVDSGSGGSTLSG
jgi:predicted PolB exonuclease-like 3'-5' exonuclease